PHQPELIASLAQRFARLHARIIKFAALPDNDWAGADQQNFLEVVVSRHLRSAQDKPIRENFTCEVSLRLILGLFGLFPDGGEQFSDPRLADGVGEKWRDHDPAVGV